MIINDKVVAKIDGTKFSKGDVGVVCYVGSGAKYMYIYNLTKGLAMRVLVSNFALYTEPEPEPDPEPAPPDDSVPDTTAPKMLVVNDTITWNRINDIDSYVMVEKIPDHPDRYFTVVGTSYRPTQVPGETVRYGLRTNVVGSLWASEVNITFAGAPEPDPTPIPDPPTPPGDLPFQMGVVTGSAIMYELPFVQRVGAKTARMEISIGASAESFASIMDAYAKAGVRPMLLAGFHGRLPTSTDARNLANWARAYGPGGTFWAGKSYPANTAVTHIEFGNETSYSYQFSDNSSTTYAQRAQTYALRAKEAADAIKAANPRVGLLVQADNAQQGTAWVTNMFKAVPDLGQRAAAWTLHPYGPNWKTRIDSTVNSTRTAGSPDLPIWLTEWGLSSDNGRCLSDNYGWDKCMDYNEAATTLRSVLSGMKTAYGRRLDAFFLYQVHDQYASGSQTGREAYFGSQQSNGTAKGAYTTEVKAQLAVGV